MNICHPFWGHRPNLILWSRYYCGCRINYLQDLSIVTKPFEMQWTCIIWPSITCNPVSKYLHKPVCTPVFNKSVYNEPDWIGFHLYAMKLYEPIRTIFSTWRKRSIGVLGLLFKLGWLTKHYKLCYLANSWNTV